MESLQQAINSVFEETTDFILIGLTGRTGSGCTTTAELLSSSKEMDLRGKSEIYRSKNDQRKFKIISRYIRNNWTPFTTIKVTTIITSYILEMSFDQFITCVRKELGIENDKNDSYVDDLKEKYDKIRSNTRKYALSDYSEKQSNYKKEIINLYTGDDDNSIRYLGLEIKKYLKRLDNNVDNKNEFDSYIKFYQNIGDNIRSSGKAISNDFDSNNIFSLSESINRLVKLIKETNKDQRQKTRIVIDAIRNPFEAIFFKQRYASFHLFSINTKDTRLRRLRRDLYSDQQIKKLDEKEYPSKLKGQEVFVSQDIQKCIQLSDIHIHNPSWEKIYRKEICSQLGWYMALILHPGLVTPTAVERCMQFAYTAKLNSGCISRQVGAVVTDSEYSVKAVGWNSTPTGQVPCILRNAQDLLKKKDDQAFSKYERKNKKFYISVSIERHSGLKTTSKSLVIRASQGYPTSF